MAKGKKTKPADAVVAVGAPTKFRPEYIDQLREFFSVEPYFKDTAERSVEYFTNGKVKKASEKYRMVPNPLPTLFGFARKIGVAYSTVWRWAERGEDSELQQRLQDHLDGKVILPPDEFEKIAALREFCNAYNDAKEMQKEFLINLGLSGTTPPAAFIFVAKNVTNMKDEKQHLLGGMEGRPLDMRLSELSNDELLDLARRGKE